MDKFFAVVYGKEERRYSSGWYEKKKDFKTLAAAIKWADYAFNEFMGLTRDPVVIGARTKAELEEKIFVYWHKWHNTGKEGRAKFVLYDTCP
jgi:hypothetical protein